MMPIESPMDSVARREWLDAIFDWLKGIEGDYDLIMIRNGSILTKADVLDGITNGLVITEHMIWFFADHKDAIKFKLRWVDE
jgi:hypothetical protein